MVHICLLALGIACSAEVSTNRGRIDMVVEDAKRTFVFEFKIDASAEVAMQQIKEKDYASPYLHRGKPVILVGANFSSTQRCIDDWASESLIPSVATASEAC